MKRLVKLWDWLRPTKGPGFTDHPEVDIRAHRKSAQLQRVFGLLGFAIGVVHSLTVGGSTGVLAGVAWAGWANWAATDMEKQALDWELELERGEAE